MRRRAAAVLTAACLPLAAGCTGGAVEVPEPSPDAQAASLCEAVADRLPETLFGQERVATEPDSPLVAAWGDPAAALRCGVERPAAYAPDSQLTVVNEVAWLPEPADEPTMYTALGHEVYVEVSIPPSYVPPAEGLVAIGDIIAEEVPPLPDGQY